MTPKAIVTAVGVAVEREHRVEQQRQQGRDQQQDPGRGRPRRSRSRAGGCRRPRRSAVARAAPVASLAKQPLELVVEPPRRRGAPSAARPRAGRAPCEVIAERTSGASATRSTSFWASSLSSTLSQTWLAGVALQHPLGRACGGVAVQGAIDLAADGVRLTPSRRPTPRAVRQPRRTKGVDHTRGRVEQAVNGAVRRARAPPAWGDPSPPGSGSTTSASSGCAAAGGRSWAIPAQGSGASGAAAHQPAPPAQARDWMKMNVTTTT